VQESGRSGATRTRRSFSSTCSPTPPSITSKRYSTATLLLSSEYGTHIYLGLDLNHLNPFFSQIRLSRSDSGIDFRLQSVKQEEVFSNACSRIVPSTTPPPLLSLYLYISLSLSLALPLALSIEPPDPEPETLIQKAPDPETLSESTLDVLLTTHSRDLSGRGAARAEDAQGTPAQSHIHHQVYLYTKITGNGPDAVREIGPFRNGSRSSFYLSLSSLKLRITQRL
jgi:hypothetical protein